MPNRILPITTSFGSSAPCLASVFTPAEDDITRSAASPATTRAATSPALAIDTWILVPLAASKAGASDRKAVAKTPVANTSTGLWIGFCTGSSATAGS